METKETFAALIDINKLNSIAPEIIRDALVKNKSNFSEDWFSYEDDDMLDRELKEAVDAKDTDKVLDLAVKFYIKGLYYSL